MYLRRACDAHRVTPSCCSRLCRLLRICPRFFYYQRFAAVGTWSIKDRDSKNTENSPSLPKHTNPIPPLGFGLHHGDVSLMQ